MSAIKIREFFDSQSHQSLSASRKAAILSQINHQITAPMAGSLSQGSILVGLRSRRYFKAVATAALTFMVGYILYSPFTGPMIFDEANFIMLRNGGSTVQAGYVGKIVMVEGEITIMRNGVALSTRDLRDGDVIYLYNTSKADFVLKDGSNGSIEGPAQMTIVQQESGNGLLMSVIHARYMQIDNEQHTGDRTDAESDTTKSNPRHDNLVIETPTSRVTTHQNSSVHLTLVTTQDRQFIQNKGASVTIESRHNVSEIKQLASSHVAEVTDYVKVYNQVALIYDELKSNSITTNYKIDSGDVGMSDIKSLLTLELPSLPNQKPTRIALVSETTTITQSGGQTSGVTSAIESSGASSEPVRVGVALIAMDEISAKRSDALSNEVSTASTLRSNTSSASTQTTALTSDSQMLKALNTPQNETIKGDDLVVINALLNESDNNTTQTSVTQSSSGVGSASGTFSSTPIKALGEAQIALLIKYRDRCITTKQLRSLQQSFGLNNSLTLDQTIATITSTYYLTAGLDTILTQLLGCDEQTQSDQ